MIRGVKLSESHRGSIGDQWKCTKKRLAAHFLEGKSWLYSTGYRFYCRNQYGFVL